MANLLRDITPASVRQQWDKYQHLFERVEVPARTILLREGKVARQAYFIEKGSIRLWFNNNGKDITFQFFFENNTVASIESFRKKTPSQVAIETIHYSPFPAWVRPPPHFLQRYVETEWDDLTLFDTIWHAIFIPAVRRPGNWAIIIPGEQESSSCSLSSENFDALPAPQHWDQDFSAVGWGQHARHIPQVYSGE